MSKTLLKKTSILIITLFSFFLYSSIYCSEIPNFKKIWKSENVIFLLSTPKSGTNLVSASLSAITRKPIWWVKWGTNFFDPYSEYKNHISYNRLNLPLVCDIPLLYRTHYEFAELMQVPLLKKRKSRNTHLHRSISK